jgi:hypothetical protein
MDHACNPPTAAPPSQTPDEAAQQVHIFSLTVSDPHIHRTIMTIDVTAPFNATTVITTLDQNHQ